MLDGEELGLGEGQLEGEITGEFDESTLGEAPEGAPIEEQGQKFTIDGKEYSLSELQGFIKGGMFEKDYRAKTTQLAEDRRKMQASSEAWETLNEYPELMQAVGAKLAELLQGTPAGPAGAPEVPEGEIAGGEPWQQEIGNLRAQLAQLLGEQDKRLQAYNEYAWKNYYAQREAYARHQMTGLREKYPDLQEDEVIAAFVENKDLDLDELSKLSHEHWNKVWEGRQRSDIERRKANAKRVVEGPKGPGAPASKVTTPTDFDDARRSALERLKAAAGLR